MTKQADDGQKGREMAEKLIARQATRTQSSTPKSKRKPTEAELRLLERLTTLGQDAK